MSEQSTPRRQQVKPGVRKGIASHSMVEHSLCPLDINVSKQPGTHQSHYWFTDKHHNRRKATVDVSLPFGLDPNDEMFLHGLLSLTFSQPDATYEFYASPYWCLKSLGIVSRQSNQGYRYTQFREAIKRLSGVVYSNNRFYDPVRGEHRDVSFGLLKYSLPTGQSDRSWHFIWDPQFFRYCESIKGSFQFDFDVYRRLDPASRRLFLLLNKVFHRCERSPKFDARSLAVEILGFSNTLDNYDIKRKLTQVSKKLLTEKLIQLPSGVRDPKELVRQERRGKYSIQFDRGVDFGFKGSHSPRTIESPLHQPLASIGFDNASIARILASYKRSMIQEWIDITQAAVEQQRINKSPEAFFLHYIKEADAKRTTPPDWWRELRKREFSEREPRDLKTGLEERFNEYLETEGKEFFDSAMSQLLQDLKQAGLDEHSAKQNARERATLLARQKFKSLRRANSCGSMVSIRDLASDMTL